MTSKLDRRKKYTRMVLKESLIRHMKEKPISAITIKEICETADINRSTFYAHYSDQYELLHEIEEEIINDMNDTLIKYSNSENEDALQMTVKLLEYISENKDICQILLSEHWDISFQQRVMKFAHDFTLKSWLSNQYFDEKISEYLSVFAVTGSIKMIQTWLRNGIDKSPKDMAEMILKLIYHGISSYRK